MSKAAEYHERIVELLAQQLRGEGTPLDDYLAANSNLPGPMANFALCRATTGVLLARARTGEALVWALLGRWAALPPAEAPANHPREVLPWIAAVAHGSLAATIPALWYDGLVRLRGQARDPRWRTREGVAMGLQEMARLDFAAVHAELLRWVAAGDPLELRAAVAALAEPDLLESPRQAQVALDLHRQVLEQVRVIPADQRRSDGFVALRKGLGYSISVVVAALPEGGFALMQELALSTDKDVRWILKENLGKGRLRRAWPDRVAELVVGMGGR